MKESRRCAYCNCSGKLTKEHLLPRAIESRSEGDLQSNIIAGGKDRVVSSEPTIGDVCFDCNNGQLSVLDQYVSCLYDKYFGRFVRPGDCVKFAFDFDLLLRWLLKTAFNFARARRGKWPVDVLIELRQYILGKEQQAPSSRLFLQLITPTKIEPGSVKGLAPDNAEAPMVFNRVVLFDCSFAPGFLTGFLITLNSYYFHILLELQHKGSPA